MYTRCPSCSSTFRVTATLLQMADGEVRCGSCGAVFNALHTLIDDWSGTDFTLPETPRLVHPDAPDPEPDQAPVDEQRTAASETLEFDVPETEWQRFFIALEEEASPRPEPDIGQGLGMAEEPTPKSLEEETADTDTWRAFLQEAEAGVDSEAADEPLFVIDEETTGAGGEAEILVRRPTVADAPPAAPAEPAIPAETEPDHVTPGDVSAEPPAIETPAPATRARRTSGAAPEASPPETVLDWGGPPPFAERVRRSAAHTGRWLAASTVAALLLGAQLLHHYRDILAADAAYGPPIRALYARIGLPLYPAWPLEAYEMRDSKAIIEKSAPGLLDIVAEIAVTGRQPVGLPMVRVVLRDRWSSAVASGVFGPTQYLAEPQARTSQVYAPGSLIPVEISLKDPGASAQGFEVDVCVPNRKLGLQCKGARDPFRN